MNLQQLKITLRDSIEQLVTDDRYLFEHDVHEQSISSKLGYYLNTRIISRTLGGWDVDVEYNRNWDVPKSLVSIGHVRPDILIHRRGLNNLYETDINNLLIIELKKNPSVNDRTDDIRIIEAFIREKPYRYHFGAFISLNLETPKIYSIDWFVREKICHGW